MALESTTVWELRASATSGNLNGGGYNASRPSAGTDYSLQDTAHLTITDLASDGSGVVSSVLTPFDSLDIGNILHITAAGTGFTVGWYEVTTVDGSGNATLDRSPGASKTGGTAYLGGAMSLGSTLDDDFFEIPVAGNTIWIKNGSYTLGENVSISATGGTMPLPILFKGYNSSRGDNPLGSTRPTINCGASYGFTILSSNWTVTNIIFIGSNNSVFVGQGHYQRVVNCKFINSSATANFVALSFVGNYGLAIDCEVISYRGYAITGGFATGYYSCYCHDSKIGIKGGTSAIIYDCLIESCSTSAISIETPVNCIFNNTLYGSENTTGTGISITTGNSSVIYNNIIYGFATGVSHADATNAVIIDYNNYYNNDTPRTNISTGSNDITVDPSFTNVGQVTGSDGYTVAGNKLVDESQNFSTAGVVANIDYVYVVSGTGVTVGIYAITAISTTVNANDTLTLSPTISANATADKVYQITINHNFKVTSASCADVGYPDPNTWMGGGKI